MKRAGLAFLVAGLVVAPAIAFPAAARAASCKAERGEAAQSLVEQCMDVSPATHPPCNAENACDLIETEIARGCGLLAAEQRPRFCKDF